MSRQPPDVLRNSTSALPYLSSDNPAEDICPVCKTSRYLNRDLEFLINPECYHPMCTNCVNRIFNDGPNTCPYAGCPRTLRRKGFRPPWFNDLSIERECDIRKRVAAVFNRVAEDFESLRAFNDYLERVEDLTADLISGLEPARKKAEAELIEWETANKAQIDASRRRRGEAEERARQAMAAEAEKSRALRESLAIADAQEKQEEKNLVQERLDALAAGDEGRAEAVLNKIQLKKRGKETGVKAATGRTSLSIRGLKERKLRSAREREEREGPYDPFGGTDLVPKRFKMAEGMAYHNEWINRARHKDEWRVGGYDADEYIKRGFYEAFAGLAVFIDEEQDIQEADGLDVDVKMEGIST